MPDARNNTEPTMEEILASIRRIIAEEDGPLPSGDLGVDAVSAGWTVSGREATAGPRIVGNGTTAHEAAPFLPERTSPSWPPPVQEAILDLTEPAADSVPLPPRPRRFPPTDPPHVQNRRPALKPAAEEPRKPPDAAIAASVASLKRIAGMAQAARQPELPLGEVGGTLEDMVRELVRPHLREWLEANLPRLVERVVRDEVSRLVREIRER